MRNTHDAVKDLKAGVMNDVQNRLLKFTKETGISISGVTLDIVDTTPMCGTAEDKEYVLVGVNVKIDL